MPQYVESKVHFFPTVDGGRRGPVEPSTGPYLPHLRVEEGEHLGVRLVGGPDVVYPGDLAEVTWALLYEGVDYSALQPGTDFEIIEGPTAIGSGTVIRRWSSASQLNVPSA